MLEVVLNHVTSGLNWLFWGTCSCVFHCFRFVELFMIAMDFIINSIKVLLKYNSTIISSIIYTLRKFFNGIENLRSFCMEVVTNTTTYISDIPHRITQFTKSTLDSAVAITHTDNISNGKNYFQLVTNCFAVTYTTLSEFLFDIPGGMCGLFAFLGDYGFKIILLITEVTSHFLFFFLNTFVNAILYVSDYAITFAELVKKILCSIAIPAVLFLVSSGEHFAAIMSNILTASLQSIHMLFSSIGSFGKGVWWTLLYIPYLIAEAVTKVISYVSGIFADVFNIIVEMIRHLNLQEFLFGLFLTILFIGFVSFLIQNRDTADFPAFSIRNYTQQPFILIRLLYEKIISIFSRQALIDGNQNEVVALQNRVIIQRQEIQQYQPQQQPQQQQQQQQQQPQLQQQQQQQQRQQQQQQQQQTHHHHFQNDTDKTADMSCVICQDGKKSVVLLPCKHLCLCGTCLQVILRLPYREHKCPLCRRKVRDYIDVYM